MINWDNIRYFIAVVKAGTVSSAATRLGVSHATVLRHIAQLEESLNTRLFDHFQSGYKPTADAEAIYANALAMEASVNDLVRLVKGKEAEPEGQLKVALPESALFNFSQTLRNFTRAYPDIEVLIQSDDAADISTLEVDVAIRITNNPPENLVGRQITQLSFGYYAADSYLSEKKIDKVSNAGLVSNNEEMEALNQNELDWIVWQLNEKLHLDKKMNQQENWLQYISANPKVVMRSNNYTEAFSATLGGIGIGLLSNSVATQMPNLKKLNYRDRAGRFGVWILTHPELRHSARVKAFMQFAAESLQTNAAS